MVKKSLFVFFIASILLVNLHAQNSSTQPVVKTITVGGVSFKMVKVTGGSFFMGCTSEQYDCDNDEFEVRKVTLDDYYIGTTEVTQGLWQAVMGTGIRQQEIKHYDDMDWAPLYGEGKDYPIYYVSWFEAMEFCRRLSMETGMSFTLPTEAQWEYAARGGKNNDKTVFSGSDMIDIVCWYRDNSSNMLYPVGSKRSNSLGLYDMSGNVWEWCYDWFNAGGYQNSQINNPIGNSYGTARIRRGGSRLDGVHSCRVANRGCQYPDVADSYTGFRVVMIP